MLAIPVTVVHKIAFNEAPFRGVAPLAFPTGPEAQLFPTGPEAQLFPTGPEARLTAVASRRAANEEQDENEEDLPNRRAVLGLGTVALLANLLNGLLLNPLLDLDPEEFDEIKTDKPYLQVVEPLTWLADFFIWIPTIPTLFRPVSSPFEIVLFSFRTFALLLDAGWLAVTIHGEVSEGDGDNSFIKGIKRLCRATDGTIIAFSGLGCLDVLFATLLLVDTEGENADARRQALIGSHQLLFAMPRAAGALRLIPGPSAAKLLTATHVVVALATTVTGGILLGNDVAAAK
jgi:hypothetical protein